jgi:uncharacterized protein (TIGR02246 family)
MYPAGHCSTTGGLSAAGNTGARLSRPSYRSIVQAKGVDHAQDCFGELTAPVFAQKAEIDAVNAKWVEFFNKGHFAGVASLYTEDATAFPPGSAMVKGRPAIGTMWKSMAEKVTDPQLMTLDVKPLGPSAAREIGTFSLKTKGPTPQEVTGKYVVVWEKVGGDWKLAADIWNEGK